MNVPTNELVEQIKNNMGLVFVIRVDPGELRSDEKNIVVKFLFNLYRKKSCNDENMKL